MPADVPFEQLGSRHRRLMMHGTGEQWFDVSWPVPAVSDKRSVAAGRCASSTRVFTLRWRRPAACARLPRQAGAPGRRGGVYRLRREPAARRRRGGAASTARRSTSFAGAAWAGCWRNSGRGNSSDTERKIAGEVVREITDRLQFLVDVGLDYLTLARPAPTLSGGEAQRIRLAAQVGSGLCGVLYVLDEPTIGMHPRDNRRLLDALRKLRDLGNTLLLVEHDREVISNADQLLDFGPAAGRNGGEIVARGTPQQVAKTDGSVTGPYLSGSKAIAVPSNRRMRSRTAIPAARRMG